MQVYRDNLSDARYEPHPPLREQVHYVRKSGGDGERVLRCGFIIAEPQDGIPGDIAGDDQVFVLEGRAVIETEAGDRIELVPGDLASFPKGLKATWQIIERFKAVFTYVE